MPSSGMAIVDRFDPGQIRRGKPEELANAIVFLSSPEAPYISGTVCEVDDGMSAN